MLKPLGPSWTSNAASETFGDLVFCALIVLVLFVMALSIEVSQRVRAESVSVKTVEPEDIVELSPEEMAELSQRLQEQQAVIRELRQDLTEQRDRVSGQIAALAGEQRFTGAREPASFSIGVDYIRDRYYFVPSRDMDHADTRQSGETSIVFAVRKRLELSSIARDAKGGRGYTEDEASAIYSAFSQYEEVIPTAKSYRIDRAQIGITYSAWLSDKLSLGIDSGPKESDRVVTASILKVYANPGAPEDSMYPRVAVLVRSNRRVEIGGVELSPRDLRDILVSIGGRGAMIDLIGLDGAAPEWLREGVLVPAGYIGKVPKRPK